MNFLRSTIEWQQWGMNILTVSSTGAIILALFQAWSFTRQGMAIWRERSGDSVSVKMFVYLLFYLISFVIYGISMKKITMIINGLLFIPVISIVAGLIRFKPFTRIERYCLPLFSTMPIAMFFAPYKQALFFCMLVGLLIAFSCPPLEIWRNKDAGVVEIRVVVASMVTNLFWTIYALRVWDVPLIIFNPLSFFLMVTTLCLWRKYQRKPVCVI